MVLGYNDGVNSDLRETQRETGNYFAGLNKQTGIVKPVEPATLEVTPEVTTEKIFNKDNYKVAFTAVIVGLITYFLL